MGSLNWEPDVGCFHVRWDILLCTQKECPSWPTRCSVCAERRRCVIWVRPYLERDDTARSVRRRHVAWYRHFLLLPSRRPRAGSRHWQDQSMRTRNGRHSVPWTSRAAQLINDTKRAIAENATYARTPDCSGYCRPPTLHPWILIAAVPSACGLLRRVHHFWSDVRCTNLVADSTKQLQRE